MLVRRLVASFLGCPSRLSSLAAAQSVLIEIADAAPNGISFEARFPRLLSVASLQLPCAEANERQSRDFVPWWNPMTLTS